MEIILRTAPATIPAPFDSAESAWFWTMAALGARRAGRAPPPAPCTPEDVLRCLDDIYRLRRIELLHARTLRRYGQSGRPPHPSHPGARCDRALWNEAMEHLDGPLRRRGIVAGLARWVPRE